jgi:glucokinase
MPALKPWNLVADIGGTNARFAIHDPNSDTLSKVIVLSVAQHPNFIGALLHLLAHIEQMLEWQPLPDACCLAVACPVDREIIEFTNSDWHFAKSEVKQALGGCQLEAINDFSAIAYAVPHLGVSEWKQIGGGTGDPLKPIGILGPGTGLGMCCLINTENGPLVIDGEGGHMDFAPIDDREIEILKVLQNKFERVSAERLVSGSGLVNIYQALCELQAQPSQFDSAEAVSNAALDQDDDIAREALEIFCRVLGSTASNLALVTGARAGIYIAGGIAPRILDFLERSDLRDRFNAKGRFQYYVEDIPLRVITRDHLGLFGAMQKLKLSTS